MRAAQISEYGDASVVGINEVPTPSAAAGQVVVEVYASSLNPFDTIVRAGYMKDMIPLTFPVTLGGDIAGVVKQLGSGVDKFSVGDKVYGQANAVSGNSGALAEYAATSADQIALAPSGLDFDQSAALPLVGVSSWQALVQHIGLQSGQKIFINGGAGGIGTVAIQIAKHLGAYVMVTATGDGLEYVKQLGADEVIDYKAQDYSEVVSGYDAVYDLVGGNEVNKLLSVLKSGGVVVSMVADFDQTKAAELGVKAIHQGTQVTTKALDALRELVENGVVTTHIDQKFTLDQIKEAFESRESGLVKGKVVVTIK